MMNDINPIENKSFKFAVRIVNLYKHLIAKNEFVLSKQLLRSGTSIGANVSEAQYAPSNADFRNKMNIALKEANESRYWLRLMRETDYISTVEFTSMDNDLGEILALLIAICKTAGKE